MQVCSLAATLEALGVEGLTAEAAMAWGSHVVLGATRGLGSRRAEWLLMMFALLVVGAACAESSSSSSSSSSVAGVDVVAPADIAFAGIGDSAATDDVETSSPDGGAAADVVESDLVASDDASPVDQGSPAVVCGDGVCQTPEQVETCPADCPPESVCGDEICTKQETFFSCPSDCEAPPQVCGDGWCQVPEGPFACPFDCDAGAVARVACLANACPIPLAACKASKECVMSLGEALACLSSCTGSSSCQQWCADSVSKVALAKAVATCGFASCAEVEPAGFCGDGTCGKGEASANCPADCGPGGPVCSDGVCSDSENAVTCPSDCQPQGPVCGDGACKAPETAQTCPADCKAAAICGDALCQADETADNCPFDCDPAVQSAFACAKEKCPAQADACMTDPACVQAILDAGACMEQCGSASQACVQKCQGIVLANTKATAFAICTFEAGCE